MSSQFGKNGFDSATRVLGLNIGTDRTYYQDASGSVSKRKPASVKRTVRARSIREAIARCNMLQASEIHRARTESHETRKDEAFAKRAASFGTMAKAFLEAFGPRKLRETVG